MNSALTSVFRGSRLIVSKSVSANYAIDDQTETVNVNATSGPVTITLPLISLNVGRSITIRKVDASGNAVTIATTSPDLYQGGSSTTLTTQWATLTLDNNGSQWLSATSSGGGGGTITGTGSANTIAFWTSSSALSFNSNFFWDNTNNRLGLGVTTPDYRLHVRAGTGAADGSQTELMTIHGTSYTIGAAVQLNYKIGDSPNGPGYAASVTAVDTGTFGARLDFRTKSNSGGHNSTPLTAAATRMTILQNGNIGIGTVTPNWLLHLVNNSQSHAYFANGFNANGPSLTVDNPSGKVALLQAGSGGSGIVYDSSGGFAIVADAAATLRAGLAGNSGTYKFTINNSGRVGIGITSAYQGTMQISATNSGGVGADLWLTNEGTNAVGSAVNLSFGSDATTDATPNGVIQNIITNPVGFVSDFVFKLYDGIDINEKLRLKPTGALKSTGPIGSGQYTTGSLPTASSYSGYIAYDTTTSTVKFSDGSVWANISSGGISGTGSAGAVTFWTGTSTISKDPTKFFWDITNHRLGIGTTTPAEALDVVGNLQFSAALMSAGSSGNLGDILLSNGVGVAPTWKAPVDAFSLISPIDFAIELCPAAGANEFMWPGVHTVSYAQEMFHINHFDLQPYDIFVTSDGTQDTNIIFWMKVNGVQIAQVTLPALTTTASLGGFGGVYNTYPFDKISIEIITDVAQTVQAHKVTVYIEAYKKFG